MKKIKMIYYLLNFLGIMKYIIYKYRFFLVYLIIIKLINYFINIFIYNK